MIEKVKEEIKSYEGKTLKFRYNGSRNQIEEFTGIITNCYKCLFLIKGDNFSKTFTYSDVLTGSLEVNI